MNTYIKKALCLSLILSLSAPISAADNFKEWLTGKSAALVTGVLLGAGLTWLYTSTQPTNSIYDPINRDSFTKIDSMNYDGKTLAVDFPLYSRKKGFYAIQKHDQSNPNYDHNYISLWENDDSTGFGNEVWIIREFTYGNTKDVGIIHYCHVFNLQPLVVERPTEYNPNSLLSVLFEKMDELDAASSSSSC